MAQPPTRYPLLNIQKTMENHHFYWVNQLFLWSFSITIVGHNYPLNWPYVTHQSTSPPTKGRLRGEHQLYGLRPGLRRHRWPCVLGQAAGWEQGGWDGDGVGGVGEAIVLKKGWRCERKKLKEDLWTKCLVFCVLNFWTLNFEHNSSNQTWRLNIPHL